MACGNRRRWYVGQTLYGLDDGRMIYLASCFGVSDSSVILSLLVEKSENRKRIWLKIWKLWNGGENKMKNWKPFFLRTARCLYGYLTWLHPNIGAIALFFLVFSSGEMSEETKRHETIHFQQMLETGLVGFIVLYYWDYLMGYIKYKNGKTAYYSIRAEQEPSLAA